MNANTVPFVSVNSTHGRPHSMISPSLSPTLSVIPITVTKAIARTLHLTQSTIFQGKLLFSKYIKGSTRSIGNFTLSQTMSRRSSMFNKKSNRLDFWLFPAQGIPSVSIVVLKDVKDVCSSMIRKPRWGIFSVMIRGKFKWNFIGGKMTRILRRSLISLRPMAKVTQMTRIQRKSLVPQSNSVSNCLKNQKSSRKTTPGTAPNVKILSWPRNRCRSTRRPKSSFSVWKDSSANNITPKNITCNYLS